MHIDAAGWLDEAERWPSPFHNERPAPVELLVIHSISLPPAVWGADAVKALFTSALNLSAHPYFAGLAGLQVSAHFYIGRAGDIIQFVPTEARAWHAGVSQFNGRANCNDFSIGIELNGADNLPYTLRQYQRLAALTRALQRRYPGLAAITGHEHIAPGRKTDPSASFCWPFYGRLLGIKKEALPARSAS